MDKRESDWSSCIITSDDCEAELVMNVEDDSDNHMRIMNSGREDNVILDDNLSISSNCYADKKYGAGTSDLQSENSDINSGGSLWMHPAPMAQAYSAGNDFAKIKEDEIQYTDSAIDQLNNTVSDLDQFSEDDIHDVIASPHHLSSSATSACGRAKSNQESDVAQGNMIQNESEKKMLFSNSSPANHNGHQVPQMNCTRQNLTTTPYKDNDLHSNGSIHSINSSQIKNRDENAASSSSSINASPFGDDFETGFGDGDVEDAYHAIFGEEKKTPKSSNNREDFDSADVRNEEENNSFVTEAATLSGVKRPRRKIEGDKSNPSDLDQRTCDSAEIEVLHKAGSIIRILDGEYCDWDGEILCVEDPRDTPIKGNKGKHKLADVLYVVAPQYSDGVPIGNCFLIGCDGVAALEEPEDVQYTSVLTAETEAETEAADGPLSDCDDIICSTDDDCDEDDSNSCHGEEATVMGSAVENRENEIVVESVNENQNQGTNMTVDAREIITIDEDVTIDEDGTIDENGTIDESVTIEESVTLDESVTVD